jgi:tRNA (Thr-GGU) A37 N-methylase
LGGSHQPCATWPRRRSRLQVDHLEALEGTPILDIKPVLDAIADR